MVGVNVVAADTDEEAQRLFTTVQQSFTNLLRSSPGQLQPPIDDIEDYWTPPEKRHASHMLKHSIVGSPETVRRDLESFVELTKADELMVVCGIYDHTARLKSYEIVAGLASSQ
jgi:alkanesulfonate monooxygenase SsuD/methylene tetrahydromethanopterin reductase-like flavin-dependent oxidoreductase (luciferase family)